MDKIKFRFLNYKKYSSFQTALRDGRILDDSIVFIQDKNCIWARGKEYVCDGPYTTDTDVDGTVTLKRGDGTVIFKIGQKDGVVSIVDEYGNINRAIYATKDYVDASIYSKQDKLQPGTGISIDGTTISSTLDTNVYEFITELGSTYGMNTNKIYILERKVDDQYVYKQYKIKDGQWVLISNVAPTVNLDGYLKQNEANLLYQPKGSYVTEDILSSYAQSTDIRDLRTDLLSYAKADYVQNSLQYHKTYMQNYLEAYKTYIDETFVKKEQVYTVGEGGSAVEDTEWTPGGNHGGDTVIVPTPTVEVDHELSFVSPNPVENRVITEALSTKATKKQLESYATLIQLAAKVDKSQLVNYVTNDNFQTQLYDKQDRLVAGSGIKIVNNTISTDLDIDTNIFVIVDELPDSANANKIYLLREEQNTSWVFGDRFPVTYSNARIIEEVYTQYKWDADNYQWINIGSVSPTVNLSNYISRDEASLLFASSGSYVTSEQLEQTVDYLEDVYQPKGDYVVPDDISQFATIQELQQETARSEDTYVKKVQIYTEDEGVDGPSNPVIDPDDVGIISRGVVNTVFLTKRQYQALVNQNLVKEDIYYFTYEGEDEIEIWAFGGTFPITLI